MELIFENLKKVRAFIFDVDGVMTDGRIMATEDGFFLRTFNIKDGYAIQHAVKNKYPIAIISGGKSSGILKRFETLGVKDIYLGQSNKEEAFNQFLRKHQLEESDILYMGDDLPDYTLLKKVGFRISPEQKYRYPTSPIQDKSMSASRQFEDLHDLRYRLARFGFPNTASLDKLSDDENLMLHIWVANNRSHDIW